MIYLTTGANGTGKTLFTLKDARNLQLEAQKKGVQRNVYYHGFDMNLDVAGEFGWQTFEPKKWMELPDNSILIVDECQTVFPTRGPAQPVPDYEQEIAVSHRKRGFDFFLCTQHPSNISTFIRKLIGSPGYHRHLKRIFGMEAVNALSYNYAETSCEKPSAKSNSQAKKMRFPKDVYNWYKSAEMHTGKRQIPKVIYVLVLLVIFIFAMLYFFASWMLTGSQEPETVTQVQAMVNNVAQPVKPIVPGAEKKDDVQDYINSYVPRIAGVPHSAPRYDEITKPTTAPYAAACVYATDRDICKCYSQQGTPLTIDKKQCRYIAENGYFLDFEPDSRKRDDRRSDQAEQLNNPRLNG